MGPTIKIEIEKSDEFGINKSFSNIKCTMSPSLSLNRFQGLLEKAKMDQKPYQMKGIEWCMQREKRNHGGIIADEMGLGKTITMIGLFVSHYLPKTLIVVPIALLEQWAAQILRVTGHTPIIYHAAGVRQYSLDVLEKSHIVLTTYGVVARQYSMQKGNLYNITWGRVVFDEAHHMRNSRTQKHLGADMLKSKIRWLITGTPIQNYERDFVALCSLLHMEPEEVRNDYMLRRTKKEVGIQIPDCMDENIQVSWNDVGEKQLAEEIHSLLSFTNVPASRGGVVANAIMQPAKKSVDPVKFERSRTLRALLLAKQCCIYPALLSSHIDRLLKQHMIRDSHPCVAAVKKHNSKMDVVIDTVLSRRDNGCGKIIFCQFHGEMDEIKRRLTEGGLCVGTLDGRTTKTEKLAILNQYAEDYKYNVLILQIQTCCEGLNLQEKYSEVYFASPHWNPALEDQAVARCHRIGQNKVVQVFRFVMNGFDELSDDEFYLMPSPQKNKTKIDKNKTKTKTNTKNKTKNKNKTNKKSKCKEPIQLQIVDETFEVERKHPISFDKHVTNVQETKRKIINELMQQDLP